MEILNVTRNIDHVPVVILDSISSPPSNVATLQVIDAAVVDKRECVSMQVQKPLLVFV